MTTGSPPTNPVAGKQPDSLAQLLAISRGRWRPFALIVEDHQEVADSLRRALAQLGVQALISHDGETALKMTAVMRLDFIILDVLLPGLNGFDVIQEMRQQPGAQNVPILSVSCVADPEAQLRGRALGAADYLCKPFDLTEFQDRVERILGPEARRRALAEGWGSGNN